MRNKREENTPEAKANMRIIFPMFVDLLRQKHVQEHLAIQRKVVDWDAINATERDCSLPESECPDSPVTVRRGGGIS